MKWLLLILLISCGHESPPAQDTADSDGDQIPNYLEAGSELQKYTASITPFGEMKATMTFRSELRFVTLDLSNESDLFGTSFTLLTKRTDLINKEGHFSEWSTLRFKAGRSPVNVVEDDYEVTLRFQETEEKPNHIVNGDTRVGEFQTVMKFHLNKKEMEDLLSEKTFFSMKRKDAETPWSQDANIRQRTYRVFLNDGKITKVYYVSKELPLDRFLLLMKIPNAKIIQKGRLSWEEVTKDWWVRDIGNQDIVVVKASEKEISIAREKNFVKLGQSVERINGKQSKLTRFEKPENSRVIMKLRGTKEMRSFKEGYRKYQSAGGHDNGPMTCQEWSRAIISSGEQTLQSEEIFNSIVLLSDEKIYSPEALAAMAIPAHDEDGAYYEVSLETPDKIVEIVIPDRPSATFMRTGVYQSECDAIPRRTGGVLTNEEGHFSLRVDAYIEKLNN